MRDFPPKAINENEKHANTLKAIKDKLFGESS